MKAFLLILLFATPICVSAQDYKAPARLILEAEMKKSTVRAVVVGVSEYKNFPEESQLLYADDDADELYRFLRSKPEIDSADIHVYLNSSAHGTAIKTELYQILFKDSRPGDVVIFYFAGHGDVDATIDDGFLLMHDVSADGDYFISDAIKVSDIQGLITTAGAKGVKVLLITDACRSGKFVGDSRGALYTTAALIREWNNALKLVSCQEDQGSMEDKRWGDGHGVFTFYLVNGLKGLADENKDGVVNFGEISDYVRTQVKKDTQYKQVPKSTGDETFSLFLVDTASLAQAEKIMKAHRELYDRPTTERGVKMRGGMISTDVQNLISQLRVEIKNDNLSSSLYYVKDDGSEIQINNVESTTAHAKQINDLCYVGKTDLVVTAGADNLVKIWQGSPLTPLGAMEKHKAPVLCLASNPANAGRLASAGMDNTIYLWDIKSGKVTGKIKNAHKSQVNDLAYSPDGEYVISAGDESAIKIWSTATGKLITSLNGHTANVVILCLSPDGEKVVSGAENGEACVWNLKSGKLVKKLTGQNKEITTILFPKDNRSVITASKGESIAIWDLDNAALIKGIALSSGKDVLLDGANQNMFIRDKRGAISILNTYSEKVVGSDADARGVSILRISSDKGRVFWVSGAGTLASAALVLPALKPSVLDLYGELLNRDVPESVKENAKVEVFSALAGAAERTITPFIEGASRVPDIGQVQKAISYLEEALRIYPDDTLLTEKIVFQKLFLEVQETLLTNDYKSYGNAIKKLDYIIEEEPDAAYTYNTKSVLYQKLRQDKEALENANIAKQKTPSWTEPRNNLGKIYLEEGAYEKAISEYEQIITMQPQSSKGYSNMGSIYHSLGDFRKAEKYYKSSIAVDSLNPDIYLKYSELQLSRGRYKDALLLLNKSSELDSLDIGNLLQAGRLYDYLFQNDLSSLDRIQEAYRYLVKANERYPLEPRTYTELSKFYISNLKNGSENAMTFLYRIFEFEERNEEALVKSIASQVKYLCEKALDLDPNSSDALDGMAFATLNLMDDDQAEALYLSAIKNAPESAGVYCRYAHFCADRGNVERAISYYNKAIELDPHYLLAYMELWSLLRDQQDMIGLNKLYSLTGEYFPNSPIFDYKKSILPGHKASREELEGILAKDDMFYPASLLAYNYNYKNLVGQPSDIEEQQYASKVKRSDRINDYFTVIQDKDLFDKPLYGLMHASGNITIAVEFDTIVKIDSKRVLAVRSVYGKDGSNHPELGGLYWFNFSGDLLKFIRKPGTFHQNGNPANKNNTYISIGSGCYDLDGNVLVPEDYDHIYHFDNGNRLVTVEKDGKYGCYNLYGQYVIPVIYEMINPGYSVKGTPGVSCRLGAKSIMLDYTGKALK